MSIPESNADDIRTLVIGGIETHIFGLGKLDSLTPTTTNVNILFFAHGRLGSANQSFPICNYLHHSLLCASSTYTLVVTFDQRNHGTRLLSPLQNESWKQQNNTHAYDMFSIQYGTARDVSYLMDVLPMFLGWNVHTYGMCGISLGGHATLLAMANDARISVGVSIIGCGDYLSLMTHRASNMKPPVPLPPASQEFLNDQLLALLSTHDPVNKPHMFKNRPLLLLNGGSDRLVPAACNQAFVDKLSKIYGEEARDKFEVIVEEGVKHEVTDSMKAKCAEWIGRWLAEGGSESSLDAGKARI